MSARQLADDCFAQDRPLLPAADALAHLRAAARPVTGVETVPLDDALGRVLADDVMAARAVPPRDNAAVDGYAVYHGDLAPAGPTVLPVGGRVAAGDNLGRDQRRGEAIRIFTGAAMPTGPGGGPDTVFMQEDVDLDGDRVCLPPGIKPGANRRFAGEDIAAGARVLTAGQTLRAQELGVLASLGQAEVAVRERLSVAVFSTGDELSQPGTPAGDGMIYDSNRAVIAAMLRTAGCAVADLGILPDDHDQVRAALAAAAETHDAVITSGGVSAGEEDHVKAAVAQAGQVHLWRIAIKPGRPLALGQIGRVPFIGLPGNPVAVMVTFIRFARPFLRRLAGAPWAEPQFYPLPADFDFEKKAGRREYLRVAVAAGVDGRSVLRHVPGSGSGILTTMVAATGLVELDDATTRIVAGDSLDYLPFTEVLS
ncbi:MAG: gephyrin-like molybdotransferase Glp [Pseudomonadota bacterium]|nr:gephyrin-like molybdotransferase Glp [Pseudomonadota bacterium]